MAASTASRGQRCAGGPTHLSAVNRPDRLVAQKMYWLGLSERMLAVVVAAGMLLVIVVAMRWALRHPERTTGVLLSGV